MNYIVTKEILDVYDKYDGDFGLLSEPWASKKDRNKVSLEQSMVLGEYIEKLNFIKISNLSTDLRNRVNERIIELEKLIEGDVAREIQSRIEK